MSRAILIGSIVLSLLLSQLSRAEAEVRADVQTDRRTQIHQLSATIMASQFDVLRVTVEGKTRKEALLKAAAAARAHLETCNISPLLCKCIKAVPIITNGEYLLLGHWDSNQVVGNGATAVVSLTLELDRDRLQQLALYHLWPLQYRNFQA